jgi:hypothetical protein
MNKKQLEEELEKVKRQLKEESLKPHFEISHCNFQVGHKSHDLLAEAALENAKAIKAIAESVGSSNGIGLNIKN